jgi:hypothetical protein
MNRCFAIALSFLTLTCSALAEPISVTEISVVDGDTPNYPPQGKGWASNLKSPLALLYELSRSGSGWPALCVLERVPSPTSCSHQSLIAALTAAPNSTIPRMNVARLPPQR